MSAPIGLEDIAAFGDVLDLMTTDVAGASLPQLVEWERALQDAKKRLTDALAFITAELLVQAREPVRVGDEILHAEPKGEWRPDHTTIRSAIVGRARFDANGERIDGPDAVARRAVELCFEAFVSPSTMPKAGAVKAWGTRRENVAKWEHTGYELQRARVVQVPE